MVDMASIVQVPCLRARAILGNPFGNPRGVTGPDSATLARTRTAPELVERDSTTRDGPTGSAYGSEVWGFESLQARQTDVQVRRGPGPGDRLRRFWSRARVAPELHRAQPTRPSGGSPSATVSSRRSSTRIPRPSLRGWTIRWDGMTKSGSPACGRTLSCSLAESQGISSRLRSPTVVALALGDRRRGEATEGGVVGSCRRPASGPGAVLGAR